jgi:opacity protein-like surface antigen
LKIVIIFQKIKIGVNEMKKYIKNGLLLLPLAATQMLPAQAAEQSADQWQFEVTPYLFMTSIVGSTGAKGIETDVDVPFSNVWDHLNFAFMGAFEARKGRWGLIFDGIYADLRDENSSTWQDGSLSKTVNVDTILTETIYQFAVGYRVYETPRVKLDVLGAARYTRLDTKLDIRSSPGEVFPGGDRSTSVNTSWWDPVIGARVIVPFAEHWDFVGYADYGGFNYQSNPTYQALAGVNWSITDTFTAKAGYRYLYQDYTDDGSSSKFTWDMALQGAYLGLGIAF